MCKMTAIWSTHQRLKPLWLIDAILHHKIWSYWLRQGVAWWHQAITCGNVDCSTMRFCGIYIGAMSLEMRSKSILDINGLVQDCSISIANALEILQSCTKPSIWSMIIAIPVQYRIDMSLKSITWWRHQMETFSALLAICAGNSPVAGEFPAQRPDTRSFDVFFDLRLNKHLSKQSWGWWFQTPTRPLWRNRNEFKITAAPHWGHSINIVGVLQMKARNRLSTLIWKTATCRYHTINPPRPE